MALLQNSVLLVRELELMGDSDQLQPSVDYLLAVLETLSGPANPGSGPEAAGGRSAGPGLRDRPGSRRPGR